VAPRRSRLAQFGVEASETRSMLQDGLQLLLDGLRTGSMSNPESQYSPSPERTLCFVPIRSRIRRSGIPP
jgi:hypothetical protein